MSMQTDAAILDWMAKQDLDELSLSFVVDAPHDGEFKVQGDSGPAGFGRTLREAFHAAIKNSRKGN